MRQPNSVPRVSDAPETEWSLWDLWQQIAKVYEVTNGMTAWAAADAAIKFGRADAVAFVRRSADVICETTKQHGG